MQDTGYRAIAIVGAGAVLPDAANVAAFWENVKSGRYSITEVSPDRWDPALYYDSDPHAPDKTYSKIGGWVRAFEWDPMKWRMPLPPRVVSGMDEAQQWAIASTRHALEDYGYPGRPLNLERTAVILGNAMAGEKHYLTALRVYFPEYARELSESASFASLPETIRRDITRELHDRIASLLPEITEDSMPGELANCIAGRIANLFNFHGPNYVADAACASAMAALNSAVDGLIENDFDVAVTGGIDRNMGASTFTKFCKIGALSATGSRPYAEGADGFVMGEGAAIFLLKRLADAERDGDKIYAVIRGIAGASDGKGKGITAPNPVGQKICIERAWQTAGLSPATATLIEGHGTSTRVGDVVEVQSMADVLNGFQLPAGSIALGSVKSNIGHLKGASGAAGILKTILALRDKVLPPSVNCARPTPDIDFAHCPLYVNGQLQPWTAVKEGVRRAGVSAFGFGGTNFHAVLEEYIPHRITGNGKRAVAAGEAPPTRREPPAGVDHRSSGPADPDRRPEPLVSSSGDAALCKAPLRGALVIGAASKAALDERLLSVQKAAEAGRSPAIKPPEEGDLRAPERLAIDFASAADLADKAAKARKVLLADQPAAWKALRAQGIFRGHGAPPKVAFLYPGQGSQHLNMMRVLRDIEPIVARTFSEADRVMTPVLGKPLGEFLFIDQIDEIAVARADEELRQTAITQPAVLAADIALTRLLAAYGIQPDMTMGHSLGEYGALVAAGALPFEEALEAVAARGREMTRVSVADNGRMAAVFAPLEVIQQTLKAVDGYAVIANINSNHQAVVGGATKAVEQAIDIFQKGGYNAVPLAVSHAFHTSIVAPASEPLREMLRRLHLRSPRIPVVANVDGEFYPTGPEVVSRIIDILGRQIAAPVQFIKGLRTLYNAGARVFVEVGPKKALQGFVDDVLGDREDVVALFANHPKTGDIAAFNQALCGLYAAGLGTGQRGEESPMAAHMAAPSNVSASPIVITGAALGLPGSGRIFDDSNVARILRGEQFIDVIPTRFRRAILDKNVTRLVKTDEGGPTFERIESAADVVKLAARGGSFDLGQDFGVSEERLASLDRATALAMAAGLDALRDAGIPLVMRYKSTSKGTRLPDRWGLPDALRDDTGVIFASVFPAYDSLAGEMARYYADHSRREQIAVLEDLRARAAESNGHSPLTQEISRRIADLQAELEKSPYFLDRRFLFRILSMGHSQFAELIGARGPNTQVNAACASTTHAVAVAEDWIRAGRCRRVIIISADDITSDHLIEWFGAGFLASGAAATEDVVEDVATPFDRRRHGMIIGMGAAALVVESAEAARERAMRPICEVLSAVTANSAFHGTRLDVEHISGVMETLVGRAEQSSRVRREELAKSMVFVSHETYTPARGGSAAAEINALRGVFGKDADRIVIANTKGFTGHAMGAGIEDVVAVKALETGCVPPVANFKEVDPDLGVLNLSKGGAYNVDYALRLGAGFGSQIAMTLMRRVSSQEEVRPDPAKLGCAYRVTDSEAWQQWLNRIGGDSAELEVAHRTLRVRDKAARREEPPKVEPKVAAKAAPASAPTSKPVAATPKAAASAKVVSESPSDPVEDRILTLVVEKTGYPREMLELELDLEADLGIDTVKQAEMFASIRELYNIPRDPNLRLRDFPTLAHVIRFARERGAHAAATVPSSVPPSVDVLPRAATSRATDAPAVQGPTDAIREKVLAIVAEKTGYPRDMLDLDLDLEADLGIDTVKQAEMFASVRAAFGIERDQNLKLREFPTLAHVIRFAQERAARPAAETVIPPSAADSIREKVLDIVAEKTGYPKDMLDLELDLEADLGIDTVKQAEMFASVRSAFGIERDQNLKLRDFPTLAHVIRFAQERGAKLSTDEALAPAPAEDPIREKVLDIVAEKTGYPKDMLDVDLDLEADLGVDTVKQAEMFASVRAAFGIERDQNLKLRDFPTLAHVIRYAQERAGNAAPAGDTAVIDRPVPAALDETERIPRRVPVPILRPPLAVCKPTGVSLESGRRIAIMPDRGGVAEALAARLRSMGVEVLSVDEALSGGTVHGVYWLPSLDNEGDIRRMDSAAWHESLRVRVKLLYQTMRDLYDQAPFLLSAICLGGQHGYDEAGAAAPLGGAVAGFTKTYKRERMNALVKAVDFAPGRDASEIAALLVEETLRDPGAVEIGYKDGQRWGVALEERSAADGRAGVELGKQSVFLITGAAGSIVSAITADLAAASGGTFYLLDLAPEPDPKNPDLERFVTDKDALKRDLFARIQARGERATPVTVEKELAALERAQAANSAIQAVRAAGGAAYYFSVDLTNARAVATVIDEVRRRSGRIDVLLHAAGFERSHMLPDKTPAEFDLVFDVKADGWFNLLHAIGEMPLGAAVAFSSIAGRFGNAGQADYSSANDLLCKIVSSFRTTRPGARAIAIDWTAWGGIGMATRGSIPKMMELAGIDMLPPEAGIPWIRRELTAGATRGEVVAGQRLGILLKEFDSTGGLETADRSSGPMLGRAANIDVNGVLTIETVLDPAIQPFLHDHQIDGTPVLPGVMGIEAFAEAASWMMPGWRIEAVEDVNFLAPFKFYRGEPRTVSVEAVFHPNGESVVADCVLIGRRQLPNQAEPQVTTHFTGKVRLAKAVPRTSNTCTLGNLNGPLVEAPDIYRVYFHGPAYQVIERAWLQENRVVGEMAAGLPDNHHPSEQPVAMAPRLMELCFQTAGLWEIGVRRRMGLPLHVDHVCLWRAPELAEGPLYAIVTANNDGESFDAEVIDAAGSRYLSMTGYRTVVFREDVAAELFRTLETAGAHV